MKAAAPSEESNAVLLLIASVCMDSHSPFIDGIATPPTLFSAILLRRVGKKSGKFIRRAEVPSAGNVKCIRQIGALERIEGAWKDRDHPELKRGAAA
jgi:hypothetical protein